MSLALKRCCLLAIAVIFLAPATADALGECGFFQKVRWETIPNPNPAPPPNCPDSTLIYIHFDNFDCLTGAYLGEDTGDAYNCQSLPSGQLDLANFPDGMIRAEWPNGCRSSCQLPDPQVEACDGRQWNLTGTVDKGCGGGGGGGAGGEPQHQCQMTDPFPVYLTSGRIETQPVTLFAVPTPEGARFDLTVKYGSHLTRHPLENLSLKQATQEPSNNDSALSRT